MGQVANLRRVANPPTSSAHYPVEMMRKQYDFSKAKRTPYARRLKQQVTIRIDQDTIKYFRLLAK